MVEELDKAGKCLKSLQAAGRSLVIVGMMGTGKSRLGRMLAEALRLKFRDSDKLVEHNSGMSINKIFETQGEAAFRAAERKAVLELLAGPPAVIATGGGAVMDPEILKAIKASSVSFWLRADIEDIIRRTARSQDRPLLKTGDPAAVLRKLAVERERFYAQADFTVDSVEGSVDKTLAEVLAGLEKQLSGAAKQDSL